MHQYVYISCQKCTFLKYLLLFGFKYYFQISLKSVCSPSRWASVAFGALCMVHVSSISTRHWSGWPNGAVVGQCAWECNGGIVFLPSGAVEPRGTLAGGGVETCWATILALGTVQTLGHIHKTCVGVEGALKNTESFTFERHHFFLEMLLLWTTIIWRDVIQHWDDYVRLMLHHFICVVIVTSVIK